MVANADRSEYEIHIGGQTRVLRFRSEQTAMFGKRLEQDPVLYLAGGGELTNFCCEAIICGLSYDKKIRRDLTPGTVFRWLDEAEDLDREAFAKEVLYTIARGKPGDEGARMAKVLDEVFGDGSTSVKGEGPTSGG